MNFIRKNVAGFVVIIAGFALAYWLNSGQWIHPSYNVMIGVITGILAVMANEIVDTFVDGVKRGYRGEK